ncbi:Uncharacterised protein [Neisseria gonorrhoeae]|nr:Uncharacterised protein [Neisseria gonorrhoeae]
MPSETCNVSDGIFYPAGICSDSIAAVFNQPGQPFQREGDRLRADGFAGCRQNGALLRNFRPERQTPNQTVPTGLLSPPPGPAMPEIPTA